MPVELPPGFRWADEPSGPELPPGFRWEGEPPAKTQEAPKTGSLGIGKAPLPGPSMLEILQGIYDTAKKGVETFRDVATGQAALPSRGGVPGSVPEEEAPGNAGIGDLAGAAGLAITQSPAARSGMAIAGLGKAIPERVQAISAAKELGIDLPKAAVTSSPAIEALASGLSAAPIGGGSLRAAGQRATEQLAGVAGRAAERPTGVAVGPEGAGASLRSGLEPYIDQFRNPNGGFSRSNMTREDWKLKNLLNKSDESMFHDVLTMAGSTRNADARTLVALRRTMLPDEWKQVQGAAIERLGRGAEGVFSSERWVQNYGGLSQSGKNLLFGQDRELMRHLDQILAVSKRAESWERLAQPSRTLGTLVGAGGVAGALASIALSRNAPVKILNTILGSTGLSYALSRSATAAPTAAWSRAYEAFVRSPGPGAYVRLGLATKSLGNSLDIDPAELTQRLLELGTKGTGAFEEATGIKVDTGDTSGPGKTRITVNPLPPEERQ